MNAFLQFFYWTKSWNESQLLVIVEVVGKTVGNDHDQDQYMWSLLHAYT